MLLNDRQITARQGMITPFVPEKTKFRGTSFGLSSAGYDIRVSNRFFLFRGTEPSAIRDISTQEIAEGFELIIHDHLPLILEPGEMVLAHSEEYLNIPEDILALLANKSTWARAEVHQPSTVLEPGWHGNLTLEIHNVSRQRVAIYPGQGIAQLLFFQIEPTTTPYGDGKYQGQRGVTPARRS